MLIMFAVNISIFYFWENKNKSCLFTWVIFVLDKQMVKMC
ncbi:hypothetical protein LTSEHVI_3305 [Salmonella enterica subsp. enterica serovar Hvittingfoss str. A4-620]|nr:hypothetical protein LTSEHVI_3305 [Salmonella enterica subsp. enterica serovar Hvittingfoss str. A4-620]